MARVLVLEPWYGGSHRAWVDGWAAHSRHELHVLSLPAQFWRWRLRGGAASLAEATQEWVADHGRPDGVVISGLIDASSYLGLARRSLGSTPVALYLHESQILYPPAPGQRLDIDAGLANWRSIIAADRLWWNSDFHRGAMLDVLPGFLARQPEPVSGRAVTLVAERSSVLWPGVATKDLIAGRRFVNARPVVLWNQRWDHDKNPRAVFSALRAISTQGVAFDLVLAGENQGHSDEAAWVRDHLGDHIVHEGWLEPDDYHDWLLRSDVVVSAADHEFFGIAIVEALAAGAVPVLPDRLSFPELVGERWADAALYPDGQLRDRLNAVLGDLAGARAALAGLRETMSRFEIVAAASRHDDAVDDLISVGKSV
ncbi:MAG: DUF3524 domain-containing protein [Actinomycetota bacterium]